MQARLAKVPAFSPRPPRQTRARAQLSCLLLCLLLCLPAVSLAAQSAPSGKSAKGNPAGKPAPAAAAPETSGSTQPDPVADAWRVFQAKRKLPHPVRADDATQRSAERLGQLRAVTSPAARVPAGPSAGSGNSSAVAALGARGGWLGADANRFAYVRRSAGQTQRVGVVVLLDERARVPGEVNVLADVLDELTLNGWDVWAFALPEVGGRRYPVRTRKRFVAPVVDPDAEPLTSAEAPPAATPATAAAPPAKPQMIRRRWVSAVAPATVPGRPLAPPQPGSPTGSPTGLPTGSPASAGAPPDWPNWQAWRATSLGRLSTLMTAVQTDLAGTTVPIVIVGLGLGADLAAEQGQQQGVAALVLLDLVRPPDGLTLELDSAVAGLQAPTLVLNWRQSDPVAAAAWLRAADETRVDIRGAPARQVARRVRGWLQREVIE